MRESPQQEGQISCSLEDLKERYIKNERPRAKAVKIGTNFYVSLESTPKLQFKVEDCQNTDQLGFFEELNFVDAFSKRESFIAFIFHEFLPKDKSVKSKLVRFITTGWVLLPINVIAILVLSEKSLYNTFAALLTTISIYVAMFSLFNFGGDYIERKKLSLFSSGRLAYFFSVDSHIAKLGIIATFASLFGIMLVLEEGSERFWQTCSDVRLWLLLVLLNISIFSVYLVLRSLVEFYLPRPSAFIMGDMKKKFLEEYEA